jgi:hypothetical protein
MRGGTKDIIQFQYLFRDPNKSAVIIIANDGIKATGEFSAKQVESRDRRQSTDKGIDTHLDTKRKPRRLQLRKTDTPFGHIVRHTTSNTCGVLK